MVDEERVDLLDNDLLPPSPRPKAGEKLFRGDLPDGEWNNACPHWYADPGNWGLIADGYLHAADALVGRLLEREVVADEMLYPVCFLYRQYVELRLKHIVSLGARIATGKACAPTGHCLDNLWTKAEPVLRERVQGNRPGELDTIHAQILELQKIDSGSDGFRYPSLRDGKPALAGLEKVNLRHVREVMMAMDTVFSESITYLVEVVNQNGWEH
jgi:hypothetical protein